MCDKWSSLTSCLTELMWKFSYSCSSLLMSAALLLQRLCTLLFCHFWQHHQPFVCLHKSLPLPSWWLYCETAAWEKEAINKDDGHARRSLATGVTDAKGNGTAGCFDSFICSALRNVWTGQREVSQVQITGWVFGLNESLQEHAVHLRKGLNGSYWDWTRNQGGISDVKSDVHLLSCERVCNYSSMQHTAKYTRSDRQTGKTRQKVAYSMWK